MPATFDLLDGASITEDNGVISEIVRVGRVTGLSASSDGILYAALADSDVPQHGEEHPTVTGIYALGRRADPIDQTSARVTITYKRLQGGSITPSQDGVPVLTGGTGLQQTETAVDRSGDEIYVTVNGTNVGKNVSVMMPHSTLRFERVEFTNQPGGIARDYVGFVNESTWQSGVAGTWMCVSITFDLIDNTTSPFKYLMRYEFQYNPIGWQPIVVAIDPTTGEVLNPLVDNVSKKTVDWYPEADFDDLNLI